MVLSSLSRKKLISFVLIFFGLILLFVGGWYQRLNVISYKPQLISPLKTSQIDSIPQKIVIPKVKLQASIVAGGAEGNNWVLADDKVMYLPTSGKLGEGYNTVLYAHKRANLFDDLNKLLIGDQIILFDQNNKQFSYTVYQSEVIKPGEVFKIESNIDNNLILFTCDGIFDQSRLIIRAK